MNLQSNVRKWGLGATGLGAAFLTGLILSGGGPGLVASGSGRAGAAATAASPVAGPAAASYADAVDRATPAVVTILVDKQMSRTSDDSIDDQLLQRFFGGNAAPQLRRQAPQVQHGLGSGVIVSADGNILTNNHVVDGSQSVRVTLSDGREFTAKVVGKDPQTDLAVVHIDAGQLPVLSLGDSDRVRVGDVVLAVGNPLGVGETVTMGIISAKGRTTAIGEDGAYEDFLQTDAPINQGNSGGALITASGELIGINSQIMTPSGGSIGIGFAIPSNMAKNVMTQLVATGHVRRGLMGVTVQPITSDLAKSLDLSSMRGALVGSVTTDGPAARAGIAAGDVILKVNGAAVEDSNDLRNRVSSMAPGSTVTVDLQRNGAMKTVTVRLDELSAARQQAEAPSATAGTSDLGLTVDALTPALAQKYSVPQGVSGLVVTGVASESAGAAAGIRVGDVLRQVNGQPMRAAGDFTRALAARSGRPALAYVQRGENAFYVALRARS